MQAVDYQEKLQHALQDVEYWQRKAEQNYKSYLCKFEECEKLKAQVFTLPSFDEQDIVRAWAKVDTLSAALDKTRRSLLEWTELAMTRHTEIEKMKEEMKQWQDSAAQKDLWLVQVRDKLKAFDRARDSLSSIEGDLVEFGMKLELYLE